MESVPDHILVTVFKYCTTDEKIFVAQLVSNRWRSLCLYSLAENFGQTLDVGRFEKASMVGVRNRNAPDGFFLETSQFLRHFLRYLWTILKADSLKKIRFSISREAASFPEWLVDEELLEAIYEHSPNLQILDLDQAEIAPESMEKLEKFPALKTLVIKKVDERFASTLSRLSSLENLTISGKSAPLPNDVQPPHPLSTLKKLTIEAPSPKSYADFLSSIASNAPALKTVKRRSGCTGDREPLPENILSQIRVHKDLRNFDDDAYFLNGDNSLNDLTEASSKFLRLRIYAEDALRLSTLSNKAETLRTLIVEAKNLEPDELASVFKIKTLKNLSLSWTFADDRACPEACEKAHDVRCENLRSLYLHLDFMSANGVAWGKNAISSATHFCSKLKNVRASDWLSPLDYKELSDDLKENFENAVRELDVNVSYFEDFSEMLQPVVSLKESLEKIRWRNLTILRVYFEFSDRVVCDLSCVNGDTVPNLRKLTVRADEEIFFNNFCKVDTLKHLLRVDGVIRFEDVDAEVNWLDRLGRSASVQWVSTLQTGLPPGRFGETLLKSRKNVLENGFYTQPLVVYVATTTKRFRATIVERQRWNEIAELLVGYRVMLRAL